MNKNSLSLRTTKLLKSAAAAAAVPLVFIYVLVSKPDFYLINALGHIVLPVAHFVGNVITWPVRALGESVENIYDLSSLRAENARLQQELDTLRENQNTCTVAIAENKRLEGELDIVRATPQNVIMADVIHDTVALHHSNFLINKGVFDGVKKGMVVVSVDGIMAGMVIDVGGEFSRVRALNDADSNIAVRIAGDEVYGFLQGDGSATADIGFFSRPEFKPARGMTVITSNISGVLPNGILVGTLKNEHDVNVLRPDSVSRVKVLEFDNNNEYK
ncbi:MAG: rod shape-determining protein MreC [Proteobacteria bacterium]|nr:rod shape-determining protein MreC [Candidatus Enterousia onthequi]MCQ2580560.1 rod shape-determining protein MreC [Alphaproteobacteria bacterium]